MYVHLRIGFIERAMHFAHDYLSGLMSYLNNDEVIQCIGKVRDVVYIPDGYSISKDITFAPLTQGCGVDILSVTTPIPLSAVSCDYYMKNPGEIPCEWSLYERICFGGTVFVDSDCILYIWSMFQEESGNWVRELLSIESTDQHAFESYYYPVFEVLKKCYQ